MTMSIDRRLAMLERRLPSAERHTGAVLVPAPDGSESPWIGLCNRAGRVIFALPHNGRDALPAPRP